MPPNNNNNIKRQAPPPLPSPPPPASSSEVEEEEDDEEEEQQQQTLPPPKPTPESETESGDEDGSDSDDEEEEPKNDHPSLPPPPKPNSKHKPQQHAAEEEESSSEDEESSSEEEDEGPPPPQTTAAPRRAVDPSIKPISTKPMDQPAKPPAQHNGLLKRKRETVGATLESGGEDGQKKKLFQRLWSLEDEIAILRGLIRYRDKNGSVPSSAGEMVGFYDFVRGSLEAEVNRGQLGEKVRRLKKKFENNVGKSRNGVEPTLVNPHEKDAYELSKKIWGTAMKPKAEEDGSEKKRARKDHVGEEALSLKATVKPSGSSVTTNGAVDEMKLQYPYLSDAVDKIASEYPCGVALKISLGMLNKTKAMIMEDKLKHIKVKEAKQQVRRIELIKESVKLISDGLTRSD